MDGDDQLAFLTAMPRSLAAVAILLVLSVGGCTSLFFHPSPDMVRTPDHVGLDYRKVWFRSDDDTLLHGWFLPSQKQPATATVVFLHGNAENISTHLGHVWWLPSEGFNLFLFDYRGFGLSKGNPTLDGVHRDARAALDAASHLDGVDRERMIVLGHSLGGSIATVAALQWREQNRLRALIIEGAFAGYRRIAREKLAQVWLTWPLQVPLSITIDDTYRPIDAIAGFSPVPVLVIHGSEDSVVSPAHGRDLYDAAREPKDLWLVRGAGHFDVFSDPVVRRRLVDYMRAVVIEDRIPQEEWK
jgi:hypothetical protein